MDHQQRAILQNFGNPGHSAGRTVSWQIVSRNGMDISGFLTSLLCLSAASPPCPMVTLSFSNILHNRVFTLDSNDFTHDICQEWSAIRVQEGFPSPYYPCQQFLFSKSHPLEGRKKVNWKNWGLCQKWGSKNVCFLTKLYLQSQRSPTTSKGPGV
jgi:hypothetical protein